MGTGWQATEIPLGEDEEGPLVATLVRADPDDPRVADRRRAAADRTTARSPAVLYVHGYNDYFFQAHLAEAWEEHGYTFYALDLRRCGRSIRPWQTPHFTTRLSEYAAELGVATTLLTEELRHDRLVVNGHSTGGLTTSLWLSEGRDEGRVAALVLTSPWFDLNASWFHRVPATRLLDRAPIDPRRIVEDSPSPYSWHLHADHGGRWTYDRDLKPPEGFPVRAGWLRAIRRGHAQLATGLGIELPTLVCTADASGPNTWDNPDLDAQDTILDVDQIAARAPRVGPDVTLVRIAGGVHDLSLSAPGPRAEFFSTVFSWLARRLDGRDVIPGPGHPVGSTDGAR
ncbi:alpha/beta hydrolase [Actinotalea sp.]|uniref:alpha/beta hydrolase n=1 Tax=Actinotalea sp. TaxID=1872145 RepID=UPI00356877D9